MGGIIENKRTRAPLVAIALLALVGAASSAAAQQRVVVMDFQDGDDIADTVRDLVREEHRVIAARDYRRAARDLRAASYQKEDIRRVCRDISCDALVRGILDNRRGGGFILELLVYSGSTGELVKTIGLNLQRAEIPRRLQRPLGQRVLDAIARVRRGGRSSGRDSRRRPDREDARGDRDRDRDRDRDDRDRDDRDRDRDRDDRDRRFDDSETFDDDRVDASSGWGTTDFGGGFGIQAGVLIDNTTALFVGVHYGWHAVSSLPALRIEPGLAVFFGSVAGQSFNGGRLLGHAKYMFNVGKEGKSRAYPVAGLEVLHTRVGSLNSTEVGANIGGGFEYGSFAAQGTLGVGKVYNFAINALYYF